jgi:cation diffusion facilitator CzcD-associated flavoprotein CzcO
MVSRCNVAIVGAGPYGLSIAAHLRSRGVSYRIFGKPMYTWREQMPRGMSLKSDGFASSLSDPADSLTLEAYCAQRGIAYDHVKIPVALDTFISYGLAFQKSFVPDLVEQLVRKIEQEGSSFSLELEDGSRVLADRVVLAVGITHFAHVPENLTSLPPQFLSHSSEHKDPRALADRHVTIVGGGASALDLAALMHENGANVTVVARRAALVFHKPPSGAPPSLWKRIRWPRTGIGPGWKSRFFTDAPALFHALPESLRLDVVRRYLGPSGGWALRNRIEGRVPVKVGSTPVSASVKDGRVHLALTDAAGGSSELVTDHIIAATGYRVDVRRLSFLAAELAAKIDTVQHTPILDTHFGSSVPGLYFVGVASANSFGPVMRFAFGADYTAKRLVKHLARTAKAETMPVSAVARPELTSTLK